MEETTALLQNVNTLQYMGFQTDVGAGTGLAVDKLEHDFVKDQDDAAGKAFRIWMNCTLRRVASMMWHIEGPGRIALMVSNIKADIEGCIDGVRGDFVIYNMAIDKAAKHLFIGKLIKPSASNTPVMQTLHTSLLPQPTMTLLGKQIS